MALEVPERLPAIPSEASWNAEVGEWEVCARGPDGEREGECLMFRADGSLHTRLGFAAGRRQGPFTVYNRDGSVSRRGSCVDGKIDGLVSAFAGGPGGEPLRACCVPAAAVRLDSRYEAGQLLQEVFFDAEGQPIRSDGQPWPARPPGVPEDAEYDEATAGWLRWRPRERRFWNGAGVISRELEFDGCRKTAERTYDDAGKLVESAWFSADGRRQGHYRRRFPAAASPYADPRIREETGTFRAGQPVGIWTFLDEAGAFVRDVERGVGCDVAPEAVVLADEPGATADDWRAHARRWREKGRIAEAVCAAARAAARAGDAALLRIALEEAVVPVAPAVALERGDLLARTADVTVAQILEGLLSGADPASAFRALAGVLPGASDAALDFVSAALLLAPDSPPVHLTRALVRFQHGDDAGAESDLVIVDRVAPDAAAALRATMRATFRPFEFWPAQEVLEPDPSLDELGAGVTRDLDEIRAAIGVYATRLQAVRAAIQAKRRGAAPPPWMPPDPGALLPAGSVPLRREMVAVPAEDGGDPVQVEIDETVDLSQSVPSLLAEAQADWGALSWLCWSVGMDQVAIPTAVAERPLVAVAMKTIVTRCWRAKDRLLSGGLLARANGVPGFSWHGIDVDAVPQHIARQMAEEYVRARSMFVWLASFDVASPFQVDLKAD
jgi:antitoxin component YwqK of YwqJK toxin-antitoxin module